MMIWLLLTILVSIAGCLSDTQCQPTYSSSSGPNYKPNAPLKARFICDPRQVTTRTEIDYNSCNTFGVCIRRRATYPIRLIVSGYIRSTDCSPIAASKIEFWQANSDGVYGSIHPGEEEGACRSTIESDSNGYFEFETEYPGVYGSLIGLGPGGIDLPPYGPAHIHFIITKPLYRTLIGQFFFDNDTAIEYDIREMGFYYSEVIRAYLFGGKEEYKTLGGHEESVRLHTSPHPSMNGTLIASKDLILIPYTEPQAFKHDICLGMPPDPLHYCHPWLEPFLRWYYLFTLLITVGILISSCMIRCMHRYIRR